MKILRSPVVIALLFCVASYGYSAHDTDLFEVSDPDKEGSFFERLETIGSVISSSPALARKITEKIEQEVVFHRTLHILELGAGDGVFTAMLVEQLEEMRANNAHFDYCIDAVDIVKSCLVKLEERFHDNPRVVIHNVNFIGVRDARVFGYKKHEKFDVIISGLPHYSDCFTAYDVQQIFESYQNLLKEDGLLRWFSYDVAPHIVALKHACQQVKKMISPRIWFAEELRQQWREKFEQKRADFEMKCAIIEDFKQSHHVSDQIKTNFPWARVYESRKQVHVRRSPRLRMITASA